MQSPQPLALIILTWNASRYIPTLFERIREQTLQPDQILVIDSDSSDNTIELLANYHVRIHQILQKDFNHGGTRQLATELVDAESYLFMTQDAIPANPHSFEKLIAALQSDDNIGCAFGRQLPSADANPLGAHLREFNYPAESYVRSLADRHQFGIKTCFNSDSFSSYKKSALQKIGGFPAKISVGEDVVVAAKMQMAGLSIAYCANALVSHSHNFSLKQDFDRYYAIGQFHQQEKWILEEFNSPNKEGFKYIVSEIKYLIANKQYIWLPRAACSWVMKWVGYQLGKRSKA